MKMVEAIKERDHYQIQLPTPTVLAEAIREQDGFTLSRINE